MTKDDSSGSTSTTTTTTTPPPTLTLENPPSSRPGQTGPGTGVPPGKLSLGTKIAIFVMVVAVAMAILWVVAGDPLGARSDVVERSRVK